MTFADPAFAGLAFRPASIWFSAWSAGKKIPFQGAFFLY
jgi:hypothetical protein